MTRFNDYKESSTAKKTLLIMMIFCGVIFANPFVNGFDCSVPENASELGYTFDIQDVEITGSDFKKYCWFNSSLYGKVLYAKYENDSLTSFYPDGNAYVTVPFKNNEWNGWYKVFYKEGNLQYKVYYEKGKQKGIGAEFYPSGLLHWEFPFKNGLLSGTAKGYFESGALFTKYTYVNGLIQGKKSFYCEDGEVAGIANYTDGELDGYIVSSDGARGNENFDVFDHYCNKVKSLKKTRSIGEVGSGGIGDGLAGLFGGGNGGIATIARGSTKTPSERDIDMGAGDGLRTAADIMKVVRQRTPGLRHVYNKYLKVKPGFSGKVFLRFTIAPGGEVISISIASSTTGFSDFDNDVKSAVSRWTFSRVKSGNTTVTIPFTFSE